MKQYPLILLMYSCIWAAGCSGSIQMNSTRADSNIIIDGDITEWNNLVSIKNENVSVGICNDDKYLYIALLTNDQNKIMKILSGGLQVWLESAEMTDRLGIQFPEKPDFEAMHKMMDERMKQGADPERMEPPELNSSALRIVILDEKEREIKDFRTDSKSYQGKVKFSKGRLGYELRIPLGTGISIPEGLKIHQGEEIKVEIISGEVSMGGPGGPPPMGGSSMPPPGGNMPSMGGGRPPMGGNMPPPGAPGENRTGMDTRQLDYVFRVTLM
ncbi:MAG: hypothetical protein LWX56_08870 [Ignavibacteria bacterium]|nr:hypothetical protein [Ignavibacteria bacterium]